MSRLTGAFTSAAAQSHLELMHRYETRLHRIFQRALGNLILMRTLPKLNPPENSTLPNEPGSISGYLIGPEPEAGEIGPEPAPEASESHLMYAYSLRSG